MFVETFGKTCEECHNMRLLYCVNVLIQNVYNKQNALKECLIICFIEELKSKLGDRATNGHGI